MCSAMTTAKNTIIDLEVAKSVDLTCFDHKKRNGNYIAMGVVTNTSVGLRISPYISMSNHHIVYLKVA